MTSQERQKLYKEAANLLGVIRIYRSMLFDGMEFGERETISLAILQAKAELEVIEQQLFEKYLLNNNLN